MTTLKFLTYNVKGLNSPSKRYNLLRELKEQGAGIVSLQETHLTYESNSRLWSKNFPTWYYGDTISNRARGVAIGMAKEVQFKLDGRMQDTEGRFLFIKGSLGELDCTIASIYAPNKNTVKFLISTLEKLTNFRKGGLIVMGDLNVCLEPARDSASGVQGTNNVQLRRLRQKLHENQLVDIWRILNGRTRDYTFYSPVHRTYSRLDYILLEHRWLERATEAKIGVVTLSDHAPVVMELRISQTQRKTPLWRINEDLLSDEGVIQRVEEELKQYFRINETGDVSGAVVWEAHKVYIRGILIKEGARKKKERNNRMGNLTTEIFNIEQEHKKMRGLHKEIYQKLIDKRDELKRLVDQKTKEKYFLIEKERYQWGDKTGKHLARMLKEKKTRNFHRQDTD